MTQQNIQNKAESGRAVRDREALLQADREMSEFHQDAAERDNWVANPPIEEQGSFFKQYCAANPSASECKVYDL